MLFKYFTLTLLIPFNWLRLKLPIKIKVMLKNIFHKKTIELRIPLVSYKNLLFKLININLN